MSLLFVIIALTVILGPLPNNAAVSKRQSDNFDLGAYDQEDDDGFVSVSPCSVQRAGDPDLTNYDIISSYHFDDYYQQYQGVQQIVGSTGYQTAYHFEEYSNMTIESSQAFPKGVPDAFSFECTFRVPEVDPPNEWYLFELSDYRYESQMSVIMNPLYNALEFSVPKYDGSLQTVTFEELEIFDHSWHKVMLGVTQDAVRLWVDCEPKPDRNGGLRAPLDVRSPIDSTEGAFTVARDSKTKTTVPIDLQWMIFSCDVDKPERASCEDIPQYASAPKEVVERERIATTKPTPRFPDLTFLTTSTYRPSFLSSTPTALQGQELHACPEVCPRGPPGPAGPPGVPGPMGTPARSNAFVNDTVERLIKGEKGEPGAIGLTGLPGIDGQYGFPGGPGPKGINGEPGWMGPPGPPGPPGVVLRNEEGSISEIGHVTTLPGLKGDIGPPGNKGERGYDGILGAKGAPGYDGIPGQKGERGMPGLDGANGLPGPQGVQGIPGLTGVPGMLGARGLIGAPGPIGPQGPPGPPGETGTINSEVRNMEEREIREICLAVVREYVSEIASTLTGPPGPPGPRGYGRLGPKGAPGLQGDSGPQGSPGERGYPGLPGLQGPQGETGLRGAEGLKGDRGEDGIGHPGQMGPPGQQGPEGHCVDGLPGRPGEPGVSGASGEPGARGPPGQPGVCPDCSAYQAAYAYPLMLAQQQQNNKGPPNYYNKGPSNYYNKGPPADYYNKG